MFLPKKILVPTDFSDFSDKALEMACDLAREHNSSVRLLHVVEVVQQCVADYCLDSAVVNEVQTKIFESATDMLQKQLARVVPSGDVTIAHRATAGYPPQRDTKGARSRRDRSGRHCFPRENGYPGPSRECHGQSHAGGKMSGVGRERVVS